FQAEDGIRDPLVTGVQTCALPIYRGARDAAHVADPSPDARLLPHHRGHGPDGRERAHRGGRGPCRQTAAREGRTARERARPLVRSEERRVGKEGRSPWETRSQTRT